MTETLLHVQCHSRTPLCLETPPTQLHVVLAYCAHPEPALDGYTPSLDTAGPMSRQYTHIHSTYRLSMCSVKINVTCPRTDEQTGSSHYHYHCHKASTHNPIKYIHTVLWKQYEGHTKLCARTNAQTT